MNRGSYHFIVESDNDGMRLDRFLAEAVEGAARSMLRKVIDLGGVHVAGRRMRRASRPVRSGETVDLYLDGLPLEPFVLKPSHILFRDRYLLAVNKPAGVEMQPTPARYQGTLYEALLSYLHDPFRPLDRPSLGMVQRLDRDTSGIVIFSIHPRAHKGLTAAMSGREVQKLYLGLTSGRPVHEEGEIRSHLARSRGTNTVRSVGRGGKEAVTRYRTVESFRDATLLEVAILTGRSHQIRAHLAESGVPLVGDVRYGGPASIAGYPVPRQMLHAWTLSLRHPVEGTPLTLQAEVPADQACVIDYLRQTGGT